MPDFKIAAAQVRSVRGDIDGNIATHAAAIAAAAKHEVSVLVFPELSLTGYEPELAAELAITATDERLSPLAALANRYQMAIVVGASLHNHRAKPGLGAILLTADGSTRTYTKMHLGGREPTYFTPGGAPLVLATRGQMVGLAICADSSMPSHPQAYADGGCTVYAAGVFLNAEWYTTDSPRLAGRSRRRRCRLHPRLLHRRLSHRLHPHRRISRWLHPWLRKTRAGLTFARISRRCVWMIFRAG